jgi:Ca2+-binding RTX toxin-like protein
MADGIEKLIGTSFSDTLVGDSGVNTLVGGAGDDVIRSKAGADILTGGAGHDTYVFMQKDVMVGGVHQGVDTITDFRSSDTIDVSDFFKGQDFVDASTALKMTFDGANTTISVDNGSGAGFVDVVKFVGQFFAGVDSLAADGMIMV